MMTRTTMPAGRAGTVVGRPGYGHFGMCPLYSGKHPRFAGAHFGRGRRLQGYYLVLFCLCATLCVLPLFDIPFVGLSVTAPIMLPLMYYAFLKTRDPWLQRYRGWIAMAAAIWLGVVISFLANGPWLQSREFQAAEIVCVIKYAYWLLVFLVTAYLASDTFVQRRLACILGMGVIVLACLRAFEGLALGKIGAWTQTIFTSQNAYGVLFSAFAPFLFPAFLGGS